jgi:hypothetical protein
MAKRDSYDDYDDSDNEDDKPWTAKDEKRLNEKMAFDDVARRVVHEPVTSEDDISNILNNHNYNRLKSTREHVLGKDSEGALWSTSPLDPKKVVRSVYNEHGRGSRDFNGGIQFEVHDKAPKGLTTDFAPARPRPPRPDHISPQQFK